MGAIDNEKSICGVDDQNIPRTKRDYQPVMDMENVLVASMPMPLAALTAALKDLFLFCPRDHHIPNVG